MGQVAELLHATAAGDAAGSARLFEMVYGELKRMAHGRLHKDGRVDDLDTTALVHESFLRLAERGELESGDRSAFFSYVGRVMRSVVIDHVRERQALKRGGGQVFVTLTTGVEAEAMDDRRLLAVDAALDVLERLAPDLRRLVEMRYFAGLSMTEVAEVLGISTRTLEREWAKARGLLQKIIDEA
jgi:RNA polymerase sigma factor (TIGR02999 family)